MYKVLKSNQRLKFVRYKREFVITEFVITEFDCIIATDDKSQVLSKTDLNAKMEKPIE